MKRLRSICDGEGWHGLGMNLVVAWMGVFIIEGLERGDGALEPRNALGYSTMLV